MNIIDIQNLVVVSIQINYVGFVLKHLKSPNQVYSKDILTICTMLIIEIQENLCRSNKNLFLLRIFKNVCFSNQL